MGGEQLAFLGVRELGGLLRRRAVSSEEVVRTFLERIDGLNPTLNAFITVTADSAVHAARAADRAAARRRQLGPLHGVPFAVKDALWTRDAPTTNGSRLFAGFSAGEDATIVARMRRAGAILLGKLNMMELGFGPTLDPPFGVPRNPWDLDRTTGGSSSGSASAVAAGLCPVTLGGDTGGSVRLPAALCGVVGLKPTWGRVSRHGLMGICGDFDCSGPLAATAADCAVVLAAIAGPDPRDPATRRRPPGDYVRAVGRRVSGLRIGVIRECAGSTFLRADVRALFEGALRTLESLGARIEEVSIPLIERSSAVYVAIAEPEAAALYREHLMTRPSAIDPYPRRRLMAASLIPSFLTVRARDERKRLRAQVDAALARVDLLASPTTPAPASPVVTAPVIRSKEEAWATVLAGRSAFTNPFSVTGHPAISVPMGFTPEQLPAGLQLVGRSFREGDVVRVAHAYQTATDWRRTRPPIRDIRHSTVRR